MLAVAIAVTFYNPSMMRTLVPGSRRRRTFADLRVGPRQRGLVELPTYTSIWRIEKRLYKLYDFRLPMPLPVGQIAVYTTITVPYIVLLTLFGLPFNHNLFWLYVLPPGLLTWLATRPVLESTRLPELLKSRLWDFDDSILLTETHAWAYGRLPTHAYEEDAAYWGGEVLPIRPPAGGPRTDENPRHRLSHPHQVRRPGYADATSVTVRPPCCVRRPCHARLPSSDPAPRADPGRLPAAMSGSQGPPRPPGAAARRGGGGGAWPAGRGPRSHATHRQARHPRVRPGPGAVRRTGPGRRAGANWCAGSSCGPGGCYRPLGRALLGARHRRPGLAKEEG